MTIWMLLFCGAHWALGRQVGWLRAVECGACCRRPRGGVASIDWSSNEPDGSVRPAANIFCASSSRPGAMTARPAAAGASARTRIPARLVSSAVSACEASRRAGPHGLDGAVALCLRRPAGPSCARQRVAGLSGGASVPPPWTCPSGALLECAEPGRETSATWLMSLPARGHNDVGHGDSPGPGND